MVGYSFPLKSLLKSLNNAGTFIAVNHRVPKHSRGDTFLKGCINCIWFKAVIPCLSHPESLLNTHNWFFSGHSYCVLESRIDKKKYH